MAIPIRNTVFDKIKDATRLTDVELFKSLVKDGHAIADDRFNKILLDLERVAIVIKLLSFYLSMLNRDIGTRSM